MVVNRMFSFKNNTSKFSQNYQTLSLGLPFQIFHLRMAFWCILAHTRSWLHHILCKSSSKTSTSCHKPPVSPFVSSCITLHFHQQLKPVFGDFFIYFLLFKLVIFHFKPSIFICFQLCFFTSSWRRLLSCCHCCHICLLVMPFTV